MISAVRRIMSQLLALALVAIVFYGAVKIVIKPIADQQQDVEEGISAQRALLGRLLEASSQEKKPELQGAGDQAPVFIEGETDAIRIASLQSRLSEAAQNIGARLSSTQAVQPRETRNVRLIGVQTQFSTTLGQLQKFVFDLETAKPLLFVDALHISRGPDRDGSETNELDVRLVVLGATPHEKGQP